MDVYVYQAALLCDECGSKQRAEADGAALTAAGHMTFLVEPETLRQATNAGLGFDPEDETAYDSDEYPKGPYPDGGGEADSPQHCDRCRVFLENDLTSEGRRYVREATAVTDDVRRKLLLAEWWAFYYDVL